MNTIEETALSDDGDRPQIQEFPGYFTRTEICSECGRSLLMLPVAMMSSDWMMTVFVEGCCDICHGSEGNECEFDDPIWFYRKYPNMKRLRSLLTEWNKRQCPIGWPSWEEKKTLTYEEEIILVNAIYCKARLAYASTLYYARAHAMHDALVDGIEGI